MWQALYLQASPHLIKFIHRHRTHPSKATHRPKSHGFILNKIRLLYRRNSIKKKKGLAIPNLPRTFPLPFSPQWFLIHFNLIPPPNNAILRLRHHLKKEGPRQKKRRQTRPLPPLHDKIEAHNHTGGSAPTIDRCLPRHPNRSPHRPKATMVNRTLRPP